MKSTHMSRKIRQHQVEQAKAIINERNAEIQLLLQEHTKRGEELAAQLEVLKQKAVVHTSTHRTTDATP